MIELKHVSKSYPIQSGVKHVLRDVSAVFPKGESFGVLGINGAGKSTFLRLVAGIEAPNEGEIIHHSRISWPLGFGGGFSGSMTGEENARFVARIYEQNVDDLVDFVYDFSELGDYFYMPVRTYSSGMKGRLAFGVSMAINFETYLIDEITAVGDKAFQKKCRAAFRERRDRADVLIVSHSMATIKEYATKCALLKDGRLEMFDDVNEAEKVYNLSLQNG